MSDREEYDSLAITVNTGVEVTLDPTAELNAVLDDLEALLKNGEIITALTLRGVNASIALVGAGGVRGYIAGRKEEAADDFATAAEEIRGRLQLKPQGSE